MALTVKEKEHWKERIARRIDHAIEELQAQDDLGFQERIRKEAEAIARRSLGLFALFEEQETIAREKDHLQKREQEIWSEMHSRATGTPVDRFMSHYIVSNEVTIAVNRRRKVHEREVMEKTTLGQKILRLQQEKEELLDTVWLATSPAQIKELWSRFADVLNWEPPELQKEALSIKPLSSDS